MARGTRNFDPAALRRLRQARGLTQEQLAKALGVSRTYVIYWERPRVDPNTGRLVATQPEPATLVALADLLEVEPHELTTVDPQQATLADLRTWAGLTQRQLAERVGAAGPTIASIEQGRRRLRPELAERIATKLQIPTEAVMAAAQRHRRRNSSNG